MLSAQELAPREGSVYFKMGRMHRRLNQLDEAVTVRAPCLCLRFLFLSCMHGLGMALRTLCHLHRLANLWFCRTASPMCRCAARLVSGRQD